jgi:hypothetical protein
MKSQKLRVSPCATTGIAAELLIEGATVHRRFGIANDITHDTKPRVALHSDFALIMDAAQLIIIDEVSMQDRFVLEYLDRLLRSISPEYSDLPFGGKAIVLGGDWKQLMPVIPGGDEAKQFARSVKSSQLYRLLNIIIIWLKNYFSLFKNHRLTINKRLTNSDKKTKKYARFLDKLATGVTTDGFDKIKIPRSIAMEKEEDIIDFVFPKAAMIDPIKYIDQLSGSALLCPTNEECFRINNSLMVT